MNLDELEYLFDNFNMIGMDGITTHGDLYRGYAVDTTQLVGVGATAATGGTGPPPPPLSGACCFDDGSCNVETEAQCSDDGGDYQGDNTPCDPNPCPPPTGACCFSDGSCNVETAAQCAIDGGTYQGDGTPCDPNPCTLPSCNGCGFNAFDGSGRKFLTMTETINETAHTDPGSGEDGCDLTISTTTTIVINPIDCSQSVFCSGSYHYINITHPDLEFSNCSWVPGGFFGTCHFVEDSGAGGISCSAGCVEDCASCSLSVVSATVESCTHDESSFNTTCHFEHTITLSEECIP